MPPQVQDLPEPVALLIACRALNPFVNVKLLKKDANGTVVPTPTAKDEVINVALHELQQNDADYGTQALDFVMQTLITLCKRANYRLAMGPNELLDGDTIETIQDLAVNLIASCSPIPQP